MAYSFILDYKLQIWITKTDQKKTKVGYRPKSVKTDHLSSTVTHVSTSKKVENCQAMLMTDLLKKEEMFLLDTCPIKSSPLKVVS